MNTEGRQTDSPFRLSIIMESDVFIVRLPLSCLDSYMFAQLTPKRTRPRLLQFRFLLQRNTKTRARNEFMWWRLGRSGITQCSIQLVFNNKYPLLLEPKKRGKIVYDDDHRSRFILVPFYFLIVNPFLRWNFNFKFLNALWLLSFHLPFLAESSGGHSPPSIPACLLARSLKRAERVANGTERNTNDPTFIVFFPSRK